MGGASLTGHVHLLAQSVGFISIPIKRSLVKVFVVVLGFLGVRVCVCL